ncbi:PREDICTED: probable DNA-directed RNA polymerase III subunit rpc6 [Tarenaya hassleriana]|uniref:probable DNA-directed RNA polymerase III subunit rpc6 n=1 Tax=Tarenaya hassleriana TaxID=28532 RepID=UPI00053C305D|nr:PREDICTED: probable DNA-directed RNA polymerase III subunit rpc6 [Tarenaya hassleriana]
MSKRKRPDPKSPAGALNEHERKLYEVIQAKQDMGASKFELKTATGILDNIVTRSLNSLKTKNLIKEVQNINNKGFKHFMAVEFEPSKEITGGDWYTDGNLNMTFIENLKEICVKLLKRPRTKVMTLEGMWKDISKATPVSEKQIEEILENLLLDNEVMKVMSNGLEDFAVAGIAIGKVCYKLTRKHGGGNEVRFGALASIPCGACPQISDCTPDGVISPQTCVYYQKWLDF